MNSVTKILSQPQKGLSLIEVALAILIVGISLVSLLSLQGVLSRGVFGAHTIIERIPYIKNYFVEADRDKLYTKEGVQQRKVEEPATTLHYTALAPVDTKKFKPYQHILIEKVEAEWTGIVGTKRETFIMFRFSPTAKVSQA